MIEIVIKQFLDKNLATPSFLEKPAKPPKRYVLFEKTSGGEKDQISSSTFAFQSYAESMYEAAKLNEELKRAVKDLIIENDISRIKLNSDYNFTDTTTKEHRYQAVFDISHY